MIDIEKLRNRLKPFNGYGTLGEFIILLFLNSVYLFVFGTNFLTTMIVPLSITDRIAILTSSIIAIGFLYYIGFIIAVKGIHVRVNHPVQYMITFHGSLLFLGILLPLLYFGLSNHGQLEVFGFMLMNILFVALCGFINEFLVYRQKENKVTLIMTGVDETSNGKTREDLAFYETRDVDYLFKDENGDIVLIPITQVKEIRFHDSIKK